MIDEQTEVNDQVLEDNEVNVDHPLEKQAPTKVRNNFLPSHLEAHLLTKTFIRILPQKQQPRRLLHHHPANMHQHFLSTL